MPSVDAIHHPVFMAKTSLLFGIRGCPSPCQQNLRIHLGSNPFAISEENIRLLKLFILCVYFGKSRRYTDIYHAGWLWRVCVDNVVLPGPELWVWKPYFDLCRKYFPRWEQEDSQTTIQDFVTTCGFKTSNCVNCKCGRLGRKCFDFSKCQRKCQNI